MSRPPDETLIAFLEGRLQGESREALLAALDADADLAGELRQAARGLEAVGRLGRAVADGEPANAAGHPGDQAGQPADAAGRPGDADQAPRPRRRAAPWTWAAAAAIATLLVSVPATLRFAEGDRRPSDGADPSGAIADGADDPRGTTVVPVLGAERPVPGGPPAFLLVLHGRWPDAATVGAEEASQRAEEYWRWTGTLAREGVLVAAGDLRWEPGERLAPSGTLVSVDGASVESPDFVVGMFALRVDSYEEALAIARDCPHLRYGGSVSVRQVGQGFVTVPGMGDWAS